MGKVPHPGVMFRVATLNEIRTYGWPLMRGEDGANYRPTVVSIGDTIVLVRKGREVIYNDALPGVADLIRADDRVKRTLRARAA